MRAIGLFAPTFMEWAIKRGYQAFFQPSTLVGNLPAGVTLNQYGWIDSPTTGDLVIPIYTIRPDADETLYWIRESIATNSTGGVRISLEANFQWDEALDQPLEAGWKTVNGVTVSTSLRHEWNGLMKMVPGEALRMRVFAATGNNNDFYFKFLALKLPWRE